MCNVTYSLIHLCEFYHFITNPICTLYRPSDRGDSPSYSSLNHSYETLNMSDNGDTASVVAPSSDQNKNENIPRTPHRPAPPIPAPKYKMTSSMYLAKIY